MKRGMHQRRLAELVRCIQIDIRREYAADHGQVVSPDGREQPFLGFPQPATRARSRFLGQRLVGPCSALVDPGSQQLNLLGGQRAGRRHAEAQLGPSDAPDQKAIGGVAGQDDRSRVTALEGGILLIEAQIRRLERRVVAAHASLAE